MIKCNYCNNEFSTNIVLKTHQRTAKYCIASQKSKSSIDLECELCNKIFTRKDVLNKHTLSCKKKLQCKKINELIYENTSLKQEIFDLKINNAVLEARLKEKIEMSEKFETLHSKREECIEKIALQPKNNTTKTTSNTQTNILNNLPVFNLMKKKLQLIANTEFTHELFLRGQEGDAKFATNIARKENDNDSDV